MRRQYGDTVIVLLHALPVENSRCAPFLLNIAVAPPFLMIIAVAPPFLLNIAAARPFLLNIAVARP